MVMCMCMLSYERTGISSQSHYWACKSISHQQSGLQIPEQSTDMTVMDYNTHTPCSLPRSQSLDFWLHTPVYKLMPCYIYTSELNKPYFMYWYSGFWLCFAFWFLCFALALLLMFADCLTHCILFDAELCWFVDLTSFNETLTCSCIHAQSVYLTVNICWMSSALLHQYKRAIFFRFINNI